MRVFEDWQGFLAWLRRRYDAGRDTVIHVKGDERDGKSSFALNLFKTLDATWNIRDGLFYDWEDLNPILIRTHKRFSAGEKFWPYFWGDEATNILDAADWNKVENKAIRKLFRQWGYLKALTVLIDPDGRLDKYVMNHRAKVRVIMDGRGLARIQLQHRDRDRDELPWYEDQFVWMFPNPADKWPVDNEDYLGSKLRGMGIRLDETSTIIADSKLERQRRRLERQAAVTKLQDELGIS